MNATKELDFKKVFELFTTDGSEHHPALDNPFEQDGVIYATDYHTMISADENDCPGFEYENEYESEAPKASNVLSKPNTNEVLEIRKSDLDKLKTKDEFKKTTVECGHCSGLGEVEYDCYYKGKTYHTDIDCPVCNGTGNEEDYSTPTGNKIFPDTSVRILDAYFDVRLIYKLVLVQEMTGDDIVLIYKDSPYSKFMFKVGVFTILIMPLSDPIGKIYELVPTH